MNLVGQGLALTALSADIVRLSLIPKCRNRAAAAKVFLALLESSHHVGSGYRLRLASVLHPPFDQLLYELLS